MHFIASTESSISRTKDVAMTHMLLLSSNGFGSVT
jgi:hypothetical protein